MANALEAIIARLLAPTGENLSDLLNPSAAMEESLDPYGGREGLLAPLDPMSDLNRLLDPYSFLVPETGNPGLLAGGGGGGGGVGGTSPVLGTGNVGGVVQSQGDVGLGQGGEARLPAFKSEAGMDWRGPRVRRRRLTSDSPFQVPPVAGAEFVSSFGAPRGGGTRSHMGNDLMAPTGTPNYATFGGTVEVQRADEGNAGRRVYVTNPKYGTVAYFHLDTIPKGLETGQRVKPGTFLGTVGYTGNADPGAPHTHFEYRPGGRNASAVNPWGELNAVVRMMKEAKKKYDPNTYRYPQWMQEQLGGNQVDAPEVVGHAEGKGVLTPTKRNLQARTNQWAQSLLGGGGGNQQAAQPNPRRRLQRGQL